MQKEERAQMIEDIMEALLNADDNTVEDVHWMLAMEGYA